MSASDSLGRQWTVQHHGPHPFGGEYATVHDATGAQVGHMRHLDSGYAPTPTRTAEFVHVEPEHRGKGAARALYEGVRAQTGQPFLHFPDDMSPLAKRAVGRIAADDPAGHQKFDANKQRVVKYPVRKPKI